MIDIRPKLLILKDALIKSPVRHCVEYGFMPYTVDDVCTWLNWDFDTWLPTQKKSAMMIANLLWEELHK